ncbi:MAG TPA: hypothetical protein VGM80_09880, partial [Gaiellaceae bacterium]
MQHFRMASGSRTQNIGRLGEIAHIAAKHGFGFLREGRRRGNPDVNQQAIGGRHLREMFEELGPAFVKF